MKIIERNSFLTSGGGAIKNTHQHIKSHLWTQYVTNVWTDVIGTFNE